MNLTQAVLEKMETLPLDQQQEVLHFVEFLQSKATPTDHSASQTEEVSALAAARKWAGCVEGGADDVSTNPKYMEGYGT